MTRRRQNFEVNAGDAVVLAIAITDDAGEPIPWAGKTVRWALAENANSPAMSVKTSGGGGIVLMGGGIAEVELDVADTEGLTGLYYHEAEVSEGGRPVTATVGDMTILPSILN